MFVNNTQLTKMGGIFSIAENFMETTSPKRLVLMAEAIVAKKNYMLQLGADQQKILRYWTKYAIFCKSL